MNKIRGKDTSLTLLKDNVYTPLCYTEETIRKTAVDYELNATIGKAQRETRQQADTRIEGCFVTRLDADATAPLFDIVSEDSETFTLLADRVFSKNIFTNLKAQSLELRAENGEPFYFRVDIQETRNSTVEQFNHLTPAVKWNTNRESEDDRLWENENGSVGIDSSTSLRSAQNDKLLTVQKRTFFYDGFSVIKTAQKHETRLPLIHRFELVGDFSENRKFTLYLCYALSERFYPELEGIEKIVIPISSRHGMYLELESVKPTDDRTDIRTSDEVLVRQKFKVRGHIRFVARNKTQFVRIEI